MKPVLFLLLLLFAALSTPAAALDTSGAVQRCQQILPGFEKDLASVTIGVQASDLEAPTGVRIDYRTMDGRDGFILCWFLGRHSEGDAWQMDQLESSKYGVMRRYEIQQMYKLLYLETKPLPPALDVQRDWRRLSLYFLQQTINAISLGCVYGLLALGFTLVFSVTRTINFAFGEFYMLGAFLLYVGHVVAFWLWGDTAPATLLVFLFLVTATGAGYSWLLDKSVFRPLRTASPTVPLIAAIGAAIVLREGVRLLQGAKTRYLLIEELDSWPIISGDGFDVYLTKGHLIVALSTVIIAAALWWVLRKTNYGRKQRAIAQDPFAAQLMGVDNNKVIALTFILGGALTTAGGFFAGAQYGVINFHMGTVVGFKALTAALLGGIGSAPGALLGGLLLALVETYCTAFLGAGWEDVVVFGVLVAVLVFFPNGLLGQGEEKRLAGQKGVG